MPTTLMVNSAFPHRKPLPCRAASPSPNPHNPLHAEQASYPPYAQPQQQQQQQQGYYSQERSMTGSQSTVGGVSVNGYAPGMAPQQPPGAQPARRTLSNATSISSTSTSTGMQRAPTDSFNGPHRTGSARSASSASPTSYVALMRKQKATVWCDRAQAEDPRILASHRAAKMRAAVEIAGGSHRISTSYNAPSPSAGIRSKIRHHGAPKAAMYTGTFISNAGVPMRLSASEVDENDSDEEDSRYMNYHKRTGSGRSSLGSNTHGGSGHAHAKPHGYSNGSTPPSGGSMLNLAEEETPMPSASEDPDYFQHAGGQGDTPGSAEERNFGDLGGLPQRERTMEEQRKINDDLKRRGSVDDRTMTMSTGRLFVANPDRDSD